MNIHEYQAKALVAARGLAVPAGRLAATPEEAARAFDELRLRRAVIKAQIHAGGRGKAGGVLFVSSRAEAEAAASKLLGRTLVTAQTGPRGKPVNQVLVQEQLDLARELYLGVSSTEAAAACGSSRRRAAGWRSRNSLEPNRAPSSANTATRTRDSPRSRRVTCSQDWGCRTSR